MKELTNEEIKAVSLDILQEVHDFCIANNIRYSLAYGSLIGAIRHKGFIPWDDDVDIIMLREDYEKFFKTFKSENGYKVAAPCLDNSYMFFGRVYDTSKTICDPWRPQCTLKEYGVWIDVFPIDNVPDNQDEFNKLTNEFLITYKKVLDKRQCMLSFNKIEWKPRWVAGILLRYFKTLGVNILDTIKHQDAIAKSQKSSLHRGWLSNHVYLHKEYLPASTYDEYVLTQFEDRKFMILKDYQTFLSSFYGDYMKLPPKEKQVYPHSFHKYYWK